MGRQVIFRMNPLLDLFHWKGVDVGSLDWDLAGLLGVITGIVVELTTIRFRQLSRLRCKS